MTAGGQLSTLQDLGVPTGVVMHASAVLAASVAFTFLYVVMPHRRVRTRSAFVGALVASVLWYVALLVHARFQVGVARYNALYAGFAAIPLFLVWVFVSWLVVLLGAHVASTHEDEAEVRWRVRGTQPSEALREWAALRMLVDIGRAFLAGEHPPTRPELAVAARIPEGFAREILRRLSSEGMVAETSHRGRDAYVLAQDPSAVRVLDVLDALRGSADASSLSSRRARAVHATLEGIRAEARRAEDNITLRQLFDRPCELTRR